MNNEQYEIMAPVGSRESLAAAINAGADSIYFGIEKLNMRAHSASTFTISDLREIAKTCDEHGISIPELTPTMFSFNSPFGACPTCTGLGIFMKVNPKLVIFDEDKSLLEGAIKASGWGVNSWMTPDSSTIAEMYYRGIAEHYNFDINLNYQWGNTISCR